MTKDFKQRSSQLQRLIYVFYDINVTASMVPNIKAFYRLTTNKN